MEYELFRVAVIHKLPLRVADGLPCQLVLQLNSHDGNAIQRENHIYRIVVLRRVGKLTRFRQDISLVLGNEVVVEVGCGLEVGETDLHTPVLDAVAEYVD